MLPSNFLIVIDSQTTLYFIVSNPFKSLIYLLSLQIPFLTPDLVFLEGLDNFHGFLVILRFEKDDQLARHITNIIDPPYLEVTFSDIISRKVVRRAWSSSLLEF